jgi:hypothetical protein
MFFSLSSWALALLILAVVGSATVVGVALGSYLRKHSELLREPIGALQAALLGVVGRAQSRTSSRGGYGGSQARLSKRRRSLPLRASISTA